MDVVETLRDVSPQTPCVLFTDARPGDVDTSAERTPRRARRP